MIGNCSGPATVCALFGRPRSTVTTALAKNPDVVIFKQGNSRLAKLSALIEWWGAPPNHLYEPMLTAATTTWIGEKWGSRDGGLADPLRFATDIPCLTPVRNCSPPPRCWCGSAYPAPRSTGCGLKGSRSLSQRSLARGGYRTISTAGYGTKAH